MGKIETMSEDKNVKPKYKNSNYKKVITYLNKTFPEKTISDFCDEFGYKDYIKGLFIFEEKEYRKNFEKAYNKITSSFDKTRRDFRSPFETARDICSNFIMEDLLLNMINKNFPFLSVTINEEENRDIEENVSSMPDFIYTNTDTGSIIRFDLKIDWLGKSMKTNKFFFRAHEEIDYKKYQAAALIWCPTKNRFTFVDFRGNIKGERGIDETKGGKEGFWADLSDNKFCEIYFGKSVFLDDMLKRLDRLSRKQI